jgi:hypothetical protein
MAADHTAGSKPILVSSCVRRDRQRVVMLATEHLQPLSRPPISGEIVLCTVTDLKGGFGVSTQPA